MNILVTNDDGIDAVGIKTLVDSLKPFGNIYVVAPDSEKSAVGHGITMHQPLRVKQMDSFGSGIKAWSISGTPSDCVKIGVEHLLGERPDMLVSGINNGGNLGTDVLYSGTVSAAVEGALHRIPSIALSLAGKGPLRYDVASHYVPGLVKEILGHGELSKSLLNINIPSVEVEEVRGIKITELGVQRYKNSFVKREDPMGRDYYWMSGTPEQLENREESDVIAIANNHISVTPLQFDLTNYGLLGKNINLGFRR
jgi:5'-nucleotidase